MQFNTQGSPHIPAPVSVHATMLQVMIALIPATMAHLWFFGPGVLAQMALSVGAAIGFEALMLKLREQPIRLFLSDLSAAVTGVLFALCLPPLMPWWGAVVGMFFAIVIAKHLYGGLGYNIFNPAMVGYVVLVISFPRLTNHWLMPRELAEVTLSFGQTFAVIFSGALPSGLSWDAISQATPLDLLKTAHIQDLMFTEVRNTPAFGKVGGVGWDWIAACYALGGLFLLYRRIISWHIPGAMLGAAIVVTLPLYAMDPDTHMSPLQTVLSGGFMLGAFFIATDPVSGSTTPRGRLIFGAGIGLIALSIRRWGAYPEGVAFSVLIMNMAVPLIDRYTKTRAYGMKS